MNEDTLKQMMDVSGNHFQDKYGYDIYKGNSSLYQLLNQAEIDVMGITFEKGKQYIYAVDVAFHEAGLNYGYKDETVSRIIKKHLRTAMCIYGYFNFKQGDIIFASPKINPAILNDLTPCINDITYILSKFDLEYKIRLISNNEFGEKILQPVISASSLVADTSELFMRSIQMYNLFADNKVNKPIQKLKNNIIDKEKIDAIKVTNVEGLNEMKIGALVRSTLTKMLKNNEITKEEIELVQTAKYSKDTFDIQYPLLRKAVLSDYERPLRYWAGAVRAYGEEYFICSEWYEVPQNNDRPYFMKWLALRK